MQALLARAVDPGLDLEKLPGPVIDICGTGGDKLELFNISTTAMFVLAAGGACVVKHGNRAITSKCGGADVLEELGVKIDLRAGGFLRRCLEGSTASGSSLRLRITRRSSRSARCAKRWPRKGCRRFSI